MIRKNFAWACVSIIAGVVISLAISWLTIWVYVRSEHVASQYRSPFSKFAFGYGPEFNRWAVDIEEYSFGVRMNTLQNWGESYEINAYPKPNRLGPSSIPHWSRAQSDASGFPSGHKIVECASGWPFTSWKGERLTVFDMQGVRVIDTNRFAFSKFDPNIRRHPILFPLLPIFPGGIYNALFWGSIFFVFTTDTKRSIWYFVRHRRRRRGQCPHCAYDITGLTTCPECGHEVIAKA